MNHSQFEMLIRPHMSNLQSFCYKLAGNRADGEDLYQITLEKAFRNYPNSMKLKKSFLFRIAKNAWIDDYRKRRVEQTLLLDDYADPAYRYDFDIHTYLKLRRNGMDVKEVRKNTDCIYFDFRDPNGHLIRISSKILFN